MPQKSLIDPYNRRITYLRMSVTDRCNFRCLYCAHEERFHDLERWRLLSFEDLFRIGRIVVEEGIQKIRLTGGEPLLRKSLHQLIEKLSRIDGLQDLCLTTNGYFLKEQARSLADAGLRRVNISVDSLKPDTFEHITQGGDLQRVLEGIETASEVFPGIVKINTVAINQINDNEILDFARLTIDRDFDVRFIEPMPLFAKASFKREDVLPAAEIKQRIADVYGLESIQEDEPRSGPSRLYRIPGARGRIGLIAAVTDEFCARCNRIRLTPDGKIRGCLLSDGEVDLFTLLHRGAGDDEIRDCIHQVIRNKPEKHTMDTIQFIPPQKPMSQIGG